ncbi:MAG: hypothetical protein HC784_04625 [Hydrococcus sp. CSU_1_8]|nr:hypothetical protein [Hydrococcus sp. CSU_1_8]
MRVAYLHTPELKNYAELGVGIGNIGWGFFRFLRIDASWQYLDGQFKRRPYWSFGFKFGN